jgi:hypothetical protein
LQYGRERLIDLQCGLVRHSLNHLMHPKYCYRTTLNFRVQDDGLATKAGILSCF